MRLKPPWMSFENHREYKRMYPIFRCSYPGCNEMDPREETIDHIIAKALGGTDDLANLQPMCRRHNSMKGVRDDAYWSQNLYFDLPIMLESMRVAQRNEGYDRILGYADWFSMPFSQISRVLYTLAWVVGAGKTLAIPTIGFALNHVIRRERGNASPRTNRILVLSKEQAIRDQITDDLRRDVTRYGICTVAPRVGVITHREFFNQPQLIDQFDIWNSCINMLFENNVPIELIESILAMFPVIIVDEPHYAVEQVMRIVQSAYKSLCFGLTGSPIKADGQQLKKFVLFSLFDYDAANQYDHSMKYLASPEDDHWSDNVEIVDILSADIQSRGQVIKTDSTDGEDYYRNILPVISVAECVLRYVHECDENYPEDFPLARHDAAPHRLAIDHVADLSYPIHALIEVETIPIGEMVCKKLNETIDSDKSKYRPDRGYRFELVMSDVTSLDEEGNTKTTKGKKLKVDHSWMHSKLNDGKLTETSARFLVVVNMGREGIHNQFCGVVGIACRVGSLIDVVQRAFGRQLRAYTKMKGGVLHVPPARLDTVKIITHSAFKNEAVIESAARYILDMGGSLTDMPTMDDLMKGQYTVEDIDGIDPDSMLTTRDKLNIAGQIGMELIRGNAFEDIDITAIVDLYGPSENRKRKAQEWSKRLFESPNGAGASIGLVDTLCEVKRVTLEILDIDPSDETLITFIKRVSPNLAQCCSRLNDPDIRLLVVDKYIDHARKYHIPGIQSRTDTVKIKQRFFSAIKGQFDGHLLCEDAKIHSRVYTAMKMILGVPDGEILKKGEKYDIPENHHILTRPEVDRAIRGWVIRSLAKDGYLPAYAAVFNFSQESEAPVSQESEAPVDAL